MKLWDEDDIVLKRYSIVLKLDLVGGSDSVPYCSDAKLLDKNDI